jgi:calcium-dependent protein kinase
MKLNGLYREIGNMQAVDHPNIIKYHEAFSDKDYIYLVMELCEKGTLEDKMN